jgi:hypothetical protein
VTDEPRSQETAEDKYAPYFLSMLQQYQMTGLATLGKSPNPFTGKVEKDMEMARYCVTMLEMLEARTKGNLSKQEQRELTGALSMLRLNYVQEVNNPTTVEDTSGAEEPAPAQDTDDGPEGNAASQDE